ncbi:hypothetical protein MSPP1_003871 [Malassezia sp. CBS 17886]|nr:hypothetical protein MSPP1_003871 [Malassezia sp. CBS 17886]
MPTYQVDVDTLLFDMDGTLISSTTPLSAVWVEFADQYKLDIDDILHNAHGKRTVEMMKKYIPSLTPDEAQSEAVRFEDRIIEISEENLKKATDVPTPKDPQGTIVGLPGVKNLLATINAGHGEQPDRRAGWAIVTSATGDYARRAFLSTKVSAAPKAFISADDVTRGKPDPQPYQTGAKAKKADIKNCIVVEDAPAGVVSGKAAGARVLGLKTTHNPDRMWEAGADWVVEDLSKVSARWEGERLILTIDSEDKPANISKPAA